MSTSDLLITEFHLTELSDTSHQQIRLQHFLHSPLSVDLRISRRDIGHSCSEPSGGDSPFCLQVVNHRLGSLLLPLMCSLLLLRFNLLTQPSGRSATPRSQEKMNTFEDPSPPLLWPNADLYTQFLEPTWSRLLSDRLWS